MSPSHFSLKCLTEEHDFKDILLDLGLLGKKFHFEILNFKFRVFMFLCFYAIFGSVTCILVSSVDFWSVARKYLEAFHVNFLQMLKIFLVFFLIACTVACPFLRSFLL